MGDDGNGSKDVEGDTPMAGAKNDNTGQITAPPAPAEMEFEPQGHDPPQIEMTGTEESQPQNQIVAQEQGIAPIDQDTRMSPASSSDQHVAAQELPMLPSTEEALPALPAIEPPVAIETSQAVSTLGKYWVCMWDKQAEHQRIEYRTASDAARATIKIVDGDKYHGYEVVGTNGRNMECKLDELVTHLGNERLLHVRPTLMLHNHYQTMVLINRNISIVNEEHNQL